MPYMTDLVQSDGDLSELDIGLMERSQRYSSPVVIGEAVSCVFSGTIDNRRDDYFAHVSK